jgi:23S rRNA pseudouridine2605 synthase
MPSSRPPHERPKTKRRPPRRQPAGPVETAESGPGERLQKVMAAAGIGSRRRCEELILAGRVEVDRTVVRKLGTKVDAESQEVRVDGTPLESARRVYFLVNKPVGVVSTNFDPSGRQRVIDLLPPTKERLFTVGRLDRTSEGLMIVTNDGALANQLAHPRYGVRKTYHALVAGIPGDDVLATLRKGVHLAEGVARVVSVKVRRELKQSALLELVLAEGRNREVRRILAKVGHKVLKLKRVAIGDLRLKELPPGEFRTLRREELQALRAEAKPDRGRTAAAAAEADDHSPADSPSRSVPARPRPARAVAGRKGRPPAGQGRAQGGQGRAHGGKGRPRPANDRAGRSARRAR